MKPRTVGPPSGQQHEPWMAEKREDRADPVGALDSIAEMEGHMVDEVEARTGLLDSYSAPDLALAIEPAAAVKALRAPSAIVPMVNADNNQHGFDEDMRWRTTCTA
jgi:hypothetical protein